MPAVNFNTSNQTYRQLLGNGITYRVPRFQRDYSWTQDEWDDLWQDIHAVLEGSEPTHYMGYLVFQTGNNKDFEVIDGQQRLTTLSLLVLGVLKVLDELVESKFEEDANRKRIEQLRNSYIGFLDPVTLVSRNKLTLNRNNEAYYKDYLVPLRKLPQRGLRSSEHALRKSFEWFLRQVRENYGGEKSGASLARFLDELSDRLFFTVITVNDELNAFKVFETLNARGVRLSPTDLLKNYLFSVVYRESTHPEEIETLERQWEFMVGQLGGESFPDFLRVHWNSRRKFVREADLFKTIRSQTPDKGKVFELIREMQEDIEVYVALSASESDLWLEDQRPSIRELRMFAVRQPWPALLAAHRAFDPAGFTQFIRACSVVAFRYNVILGLATNEQERVYNDVALKIASKEIPAGTDAVRALARIYQADDAFKQGFADKVLRTTAARNRNVARYILFELERHLSGVELDIDSSRYSLEHILPENPSDDWTGFTDEQFSEFLHRLGNLTLLETKTNREIGNADFATKRTAFSKSSLVITQRIADENAEWTPERIAERQRWMAKQATSIWRLSFRS